jgi:hypothetical protein
LTAQRPQPELATPGMDGDLDQESLTIPSQLQLEAVDDKGLHPLLTDIARGFVCGS